MVHQHLGRPLAVPSQANTHTGRDAHYFWRCCCRHLPILANALAQLDATNLDAHALTSNVFSSSIHVEQQQQQQEDPSVAAAAEQAAEAARHVLSKLCAVVQHLPAAAFDAAGVTRFVSSMARLGYYDWQAMRHVSHMAAASAKVAGFYILSLSSISFRLAISVLWFSIDLQM